MTDKHARLLALAYRRRAAEWPRERGYKCIGDYHRGVYECDFVSPYTRGACNVDAQLMILLQDWASDDVLSGPHPDGELLSVMTRLAAQTNGSKLRCTSIFDWTLRTPMQRTYSRSSRSAGWMPRYGNEIVRAAREFALPQIEIVRPRLAVCLGKAAFNRSLKNPLALAL